MNKIKKYENIYINHDFERIQFFRLIKSLKKVEKILYPGCSFHITPSLIFPDVTYMDKDTNVANFFSNRNGIEQYISAHKEYKSKSHFSFVKLDYAQDKIREQFDMIISIFADSAGQYLPGNLRKGGLIISNDFRSEIKTLISRKDLKLIGHIKKNKKKYEYINEAPNRSLTSKGRDFVQKNGTYTYRDKEIYYVFEKIE